MKIRNKVARLLKSLVYRLTGDSRWEIINEITNKIDNDNNKLLFKFKAESLTEKTMNSTSSGISSEKCCGEHDLIVSLTSYGNRLYDVYLPIESIMQGSLKPNRIILWLSDSLMDTELPITLKKQQNRGLEIKYREDLRSYTKIIHSLKEYQDACIITIDDDAIYNFDLVENLVSAYLKEPQYIHSSRIHRIIIGDDGNPVSYLKWKWCDHNDEPSNLNFLTGVGGVLYPPNAFPKEVFNKSVFLDICKTADDIWLNAMAMLNNTLIKKAFTHNPSGDDYLVNDNVQDTSLYKTKVINNQNDISFYNVYSRYGLWRKLSSEKTIIK